MRGILEAANGESTMREVFEEVGEEVTFQRVNHVRLKLATSVYPYLKLSRQLNYLKA